MVSRKLMIINKLGLHARAAAKFVALASKFRCTVEILRNTKRVNGKSIMGVMMLAASQGSEIELVIEGDDESPALDALEQLILDRFGEAE